MTDAGNIEIYFKTLFKGEECQKLDAEAICELNVSEMGYEYPKDKTQQKLKQLLKSGKDKILVAVIDGIVAGYVHANDYDVIYAPHMKNIMGIAVSDHFKKKGIGSKSISGKCFNQT